MHLERVWEWILSFLPTPLPKGMSDLEEFTQSILRIYSDIPDNESTHFAISNMIMHTSGATAYVSKRHFAKTLYNAMAKEVAFEKQRLLREERKQKTEAAKAQEEATVAEEITPVQSA